MAYQDAIGDKIPAISFSTENDGSVKYVQILPFMKNLIWGNRLKGESSWGLPKENLFKLLACNKLVIAEFQLDDTSISSISMILFIVNILKQMGKYIQTILVSILLLGKPRTVDM